MPALRDEGALVEPAPATSAIGTRRMGERLTHVGDGFEAGAHPCCEVVGQLSVREAALRVNGKVSAHLDVVIGAVHRVDGGNELLTIPPVGCGKELLLAPTRLRIGIPHCANTEEALARIEGEEWSSV